MKKIRISSSYKIIIAIMTIAMIATIILATLAVKNTHSAIKMLCTAVKNAEVQGSGACGERFYSFSGAIG